MNQVAFKIYRTKFNGDHFAESSGIGFQEGNSLIVPMLSGGDTPKAYLREFVLNNNFREYNGWHYGIVTFVAKTQDGTLIPQDWHVSYRAFETDAEQSAKVKQPAAKKITADDIKVGAVLKTKDDRKVKVAAVKDNVAICDYDDGTQHRLGIDNIIKKQTLVLA